MKLQLNSKEFMLITFLVLSELGNSEVLFGFIVAYLVYFILRYGIRKSIININLSLILIFLIGLFSSIIPLINSKYIIRDVIRDIFLTLTPILYISFGIYIEKINGYESIRIYRSIIYSGVIISIEHLFNILININVILAGTNIRDLGNKDSYINILSLVLILFIDKNILKTIINKKVNLFFCRLILVMSFLLYFSRTNIILFLCFVAIELFITKKVNFKKVIKVALSIFIVVVLAFKFVPNDSMNKFINKFKRSFTEISFNDEKSWTWQNINNDWRGYEIHRTLMEYNEGTIISKLFGWGYGKRIPLGLQIYLNNEMFSEISILHNGYYYILIKAGMLSLMLYLFFIIKLMILSFKKIIKDRLVFESKLVLGILVCILLSTYTVRGLYSKGSIFVFCMLIGYFNSKFKNNCYI